MTTQHTPGPWNTDANCIVSGQSNQENADCFVADCSQHGETENYTLQELANARLAAAAPDLLAALQAVWKFFEPVYVSAMADDTERTAQDELIDTVRAAIADATG